MSERSNEKKRFIATVKRDVDLEVNFTVKASNPKEAYEKYLELTKDPANLRKIIKENGKIIRSKIVGINLARDTEGTRKIDLVTITEVPQTCEPVVNNVLSMQDYLNRQSD